jgi:hypothetical protein
MNLGSQPIQPEKHAKTGFGLAAAPWQFPARQEELWDDDLD